MKYEVKCFRARRAVIFLGSHSTPPETKAFRPLTLLRLQSFPRFHSDHHNNKGDLG